MNKFAIWFSRVVWVGIFANCVLALPTLLMPGQMLAMMSLPAAWPVMWPGFAALLLLLLSLFYIPAALRPLHYPAGFVACGAGATRGGHLLFRLQPRLFLLWALRPGLSCSGGGAAIPSGAPAKEPAGGTSR